MVNCQLDDVVLMSRSRVGIVRYRGQLSGHNKSNKMYIGVEIFMTDSEYGNSNGSYNGIIYFKCQQNHGIFVPEKDIKRVIDSEELLKKLVILSNRNQSLTIENKHLSDLSITHIKSLNDTSNTLKDLEIAHNELQKEIESLKYQLMLNERDKKYWNYNINMHHNNIHNNNQNHNINNNDKNDPFKMISTNNLINLKKYLSKNKNIINVFNDEKKGNLPIWSVKKANINALRILCEFHADFDQRDDMGWSPLMYSIIYNNYEIAKELISFGCNIEILDEGCWSSVIFCCILNNDVLLNLLAQNNANLNRFIYANKTPLILCAERGYFKCLKVLKDFNVDNIVDAVKIVTESDHKFMTPINRKKSIQILTNKKI